MPIRSQAQRRKLRALMSQGKLSKAKYREMERGTPKNLPEYVGKRPKRRRVCVRKGYSKRARRTVCRKFAWRGGRPKSSRRVTKRTRSR